MEFNERPVRYIITQPACRANISEENPYKNRLLTPPFTISFRCRIFNLLMLHRTLNIIKLLFTVYCIFFSNILFAQSSSRASDNQNKQHILQIVAEDSTYQLPDRYIVIGTLKVILDTVLLELNRDYIFDSQNSQIKFLPEFITNVSRDSSSKKEVKINYRVFPFEFKSKYAHRELVFKKDSSTGKLVQTSKPLSLFTVDNIFNENLQKSGSIVRGFTFGSNRDLSLNSGFRMQMAGKLSDDIDIAAALTDENSPIQPEGNTQTLQEIDKVFIELKTKNMSATLGDFNLDFTGTEFGKISRKLQGGLGSVRYDAGDVNGNVSLSGAVTRGKYNTNQFLGIEGVQGPYRLSGKNNERNIIIIAGTEKVYVDGEQMKRGDENDYIIDYALSELTFTSRRLINGNSRVVVDFEYTDRQYTRNFFATQGSSNIFDDRFNVVASFIREGDDYSNPIDLTLTDADKETLRTAGDNRFRAIQNGAQYVGYGKGQYVMIDTTINTQSYTIFRYAPGDTAAKYSVTSTYVGDGKGDYSKVSIGNYRYVGVGLGSYLPIRFLPLPQLQTLIDVDLKAKVTNYLRFFGETAVSNYDANRFSNLDDGDNQGGAYKFGLQFNPQDVTIGTTNIGSFDLQLRERIISGQFVPIDRINVVEFGRKWNLNQTTQLNEASGEGLLNYQPIKSVRINSGLGYMKMGNQFTSTRTLGEFDFSETTLPKINYQFELIKSKDKSSDALGNWRRNKALTEYTFWKITPSFMYENETKKQNSIASDTLQSGSFSFNEYSPKLKIKDIYTTTFGMEYKWREENRFYNRALVKESNTFTQIYTISSQPLRTLSTSADVTLRKREYTAEFKGASGGNTESILIRWLTRLAALDRALESDLLYDASTQRSAKMERVFQRVPKGTGSYVYIGDIDSNGIATEDEFRPTRFDGDYVPITIPSDNLSPVIDLRLSGRIRFVPSKLISESNWFGQTVSAFSTETFVRIEEKSTETVQRNIYFLNMKYFQNEKTTLAGSNSITQDVFLFEQSQEFYMRFRFQQRKSMTQYALGTERGYNRERSVRVRWQLVPEIANQTDYENKTDQVGASKYSYRVRNIKGDLLTSDWAYRPNKNIEMGFKISVGRAENKDESSNSVADINTQGIRLIYSFEEKGLARVEFNREEVLVLGAGLNLPYELTGGRLRGKTWLWRTSADYRFTNFLQATLNYEGRSEGLSLPIHSMRAEVRAFF